MSKGWSLGKATLYGLSITIPILLFVLVPFIVWLVLPQTNDYKQLFEMLSWVFPTIVIGGGFLFFVGYFIYDGIKQSKSRTR